MPAEHGSVQPGGLRREHIVAAAMVAAVTVVLGFASGFGVREVGAALGPPANPGGPVATQPGGPVAPPLAALPPAGAARPSGSQVGLRPNPPVASGAADGSGVMPGAMPGFDFGGWPMFPPEPAGGPAAPPAGPGAPAPQCPPGILDQLLQLLAEVLDGTTPTQALSNAGAVVPAPTGPATARSETGSGTAGSGTLLPGVAVDVPVLLPAGEGAVLVVGLIPLLDAVARWEVAHREDAPQPGARPAGPLAPVAPQPTTAVADDPAAAPGNQLGALATLLAPAGLMVDPGTGVVDPLLAPVLGSLGCGGIVPATAPAAGQPGAGR